VGVVMSGVGRSVREWGGEVGRSVKGGDLVEGRGVTGDVCVCMAASPPRA
jgi:hypothetical protein